MTVPQCVDAPDGGQAHGANAWHVVVITVITVVIVLACAGVTPEWITAAAAVCAAVGRTRQ
ncbi:hypothetical protein [Streptomyces sp. RK9]|uniref:hypothetical protein n=1 Tax=Streptomyces sp. RK9 TaxID=3239284 RepID=UPI00386E26BE